MLGICSSHVPTIIPPWLFIWLTTNGISKRRLKTICPTGLRIGTAGSGMQDICSRISAPLSLIPDLIFLSQTATRLRKAAGADVARLRAEKMRRKCEQSLNSRGLSAGPAFPSSLKLFKLVRKWRQTWRKSSIRCFPNTESERVADGNPFATHDP